MTSAARFTAEGLAHHQAGRREEAAACYRQALVLDPAHADSLHLLGVISLQLGQHEQAIAMIQHAISVRGDQAAYHSNLGAAFRILGRLDEAAASFRRALVLTPDYAEAYSNLGTTLRGQGFLREAADCFRRAVTLQPGYAVAHSNLVYCLNFDSDLSPAAVLAEHACWGMAHAPPQAASGFAPRRPGRLRIGYVSPDFRDHSVDCFFEPLLRHHDRATVESFCYANVARPDAVTARLQGLADHWRNILGVGDAEVASQIRRDGIDLLVDLAGHTSGNRLTLFAYRPAPIQATWLGYPNRTGVSTIDYRLVDTITDPMGAAEPPASEQLVRLPDGFLCYQPPEGAPAPTEPPSSRNGFVTFGSFNNPSKLSLPTLKCWARILISVPGSRLLLKGQSFADTGTRDLFLERLVACGVSPECVTLLPQTATTAAHLALYDQIDIALDPFPYNGTTTSCEALWMGVPVICLRGDRHAARVGASLLTHAGLPDLIADHVDDYIGLAQALAADVMRRAALRQGLRAQLAGSKLCDARAFARKFEETCRALVFKAS